MRRERLRDYAILLAVSAALTLPNLGATSLWDVDEGVNAEAAREMRDNGTWVIPTFNYQLRTAKPVMLYWLQRGTYTAFGVSEWSARLPSVLAAWLTVLLTYELARGMFGRATGLLAGVVLASVVEFCVLAHAATPDATLLLFTTLTYFLFWSRHENGARRWWVPTAAACGLSVLTKGPVGLALPGLVILAYFAWNRELGRLLDRKIGWAVLAFVLVAGPWYGLVTAETRGVWAGTFFGRENLQRFTTPMENHRGPALYHAAALLVLFTPWSAFLLGAVWYGFKATRRGGPTPPAPLPEGKGEEEPNPPTPFPKKEGGVREESAALGPSPLGGGVGEGSSASPRPYRFLICWFAVYLVFFSAAATKLPNYMLPVYPALAILTARFLVRWRAGDLTLPRWMMPSAVTGVVVTAVAVFGGLLVAGDAVNLLPAGARVFPGLERWAVLAVVPLIAAVVMARAVRANDRVRFVQAMTVGAVTFTALAAAFPSQSVDEQKAPKELVRLSGVDDPTRDIRLGHFDWFQPSLVFYARRELVEVFTPDKAAEFLAVPTPGYLFVPAETWEQVEPKLVVPIRIVARHRDFYRNCDVLVVTNEVTVTASR